MYKSTLMIWGQDDLCTRLTATDGEAFTLQDGPYTVAGVHRVWEFVASNARLRSFPRRSVCGRWEPRKTAGGPRRRADWEHVAFVRQEQD